MEAGDGSMVELAPCGFTAVCFAGFLPGKGGRLGLGMVTLRQCK
jgi:hypothetical protein